MKALDLEVMAVNSNSCIDSIESKPTELTLVKSSSFPRIPEITITVTRGDEFEEFESFKSFEDWAIDECDKDFYTAYRNADSDSRRGCDGMKEWVNYTFDSLEIIEFVEEKGWKVARVAK